MAGDVKVAVVSGTTSPNADGTADFTKTDFGTPGACIVLYSFDGEDNTSVTGTSKQSTGFSDFTNDYCIAHQDKSASAKVDCDAIKSNTLCYVRLSSSGSAETGGTASAITDGVRLTNNSDTPPPPTSVFATVIMFGGADQTADIRRTGINSSQDGTATITHSGFTDGNDKLIFFIGTDISGEDSANSGINNSFGVCHVSGSDGGGYTFTNRCFGWASDHGDTVGDPIAIMRDNRCLSILTEGAAQDWGLEVTAFSSSGNTFTVTTRDAGAGAGMEVYSLALDLDDRTAKVGSVDSPTSGATWTPSVSLGFTPQYVGLLVNQTFSVNGIHQGAQAGPVGISSNTGSGEETCHSWYNEDASVTTNTNNLFRSRAIDLRKDDVSGILFDFSHSSFNSGDWTYSVAITEGTARNWFYWAIEAVAGVAPPTPPLLLQRPTPYTVRV